MKNKVVVFTGAGMSAESGIRTFRDTGGLWEEYSIYEVATPEAWAINKATVLRFYNERRLALQEVEPNAGHRALKELETHFETTIITQNVDDLHERAGSSSIVHLHGELNKVRSTRNPEIILDYTGRALSDSDKGPDGAPLRPHIVWFGEAVPEMDRAASIASQADILLVVGTSLQVYPAAGLLQVVPDHCETYYVDPEAFEVPGARNLTVLRGKAADVLPGLITKLKAQKKAE